MPDDMYAILQKDVYLDVQQFAFAFAGIVKDYYYYFYDDHYYYDFYL